MSDFEAHLAALRGRFRARLAEEREQLRVALESDDRETLARVAHRLAGSAGTFGAPEISDAAARVEQCLDEGGTGEEIAHLVGALTERMIAEEQGG